MRGPATLSSLLHRAAVNGSPRAAARGAGEAPTLGRRARRTRRALARDERRARSLLDVGRYLIAGDVLEETVGEVLLAVARGIPVQSAVCTLGTVTVEWHSAIVDDGALDTAVERARAVSRYLTGDDDEWPPAAAREVTRQSALQSQRRPSFVNLPLVSAASALAASRSAPSGAATIVVGALQLEAAAPGLDEEDLTFISIIAQQLAAGVERLMRAHALRATVAEHAAVIARERDDAEKRLAGLRELHDRYEALVDNLENTFVWEADPDAMVLTYVSARVTEVLGFERAALDRDARELARFLHPDDVPAVIEALLGAISDARDASLVHRCAAANGGYRWLHTGVHVMGIDTGRPRLQGVSMDVTEMKLAEQRALFIAEASRRLASASSLQEALTVTSQISTPLLGDVSMFDELSDGGQLRRLSTRIDAPNGDEIARIVSLDAPHAVTARARALATTTPVLLSDGPSSDERYRNAMRAAGIVGVMIVPVVARDHVFGVLTFAASRAWGRSFTAQDFSFAQDVARRAAVALDGARLYEAAQHAVRAREDLLAIVSHDLKNPLSVMLLNLDMLTRMPPQEDRRRSRRQIAGIARAAESMSALIQDLLEAARVEGLHLSVTTQAVSPRSLMREVEDTLGLLTVEKGLRLVTEIADDLPLVLADRARVRQVFANLVGNAIKFTPPGGTITVRAALLRGGDSGAPDAVRFSVEDTGSGIPAADLPYVFDRFWQAKDTARLGTGLGLFIVKGIVEAQLGRAWVESELGRGTTFFFTLPIAGKR